MRALRILVPAALVACLAPAVARAADAVPEPPFHISADNLTGGRDASGDVLFLNGNLVVVRGRTHLTADNGRYVDASGLIDLNGHVKLVDSTTTVTCDHAQFSKYDDRLNLDGNVVIRDHDAVLRSPAGWYDRKRGFAHAMGGVTGSEKQQRMASDEATYVRDSMLVQARGRVRGWDDENKMELDADSVDFHRRTRVAVASGHPVLRMQDDEGHPAIMRSMRMRVDSGTRVAEALDSVTVERDTLRARADYARFDDRSGIGLLLGSPRAWDQETTVRGDTLETYSVQRKLRSVTVRHGAVMDYAGSREANAGETNRLTGRDMVAFVTGNTIDSLVAIGDARNDYASPSRTGKTKERNQASGDTILVYFDDRKIDRARVQGAATGEYRPSVDAADTAAVASEVIRYDGRHIDFVVPKNRIVLDGAAHLTYRELELNAQQVEFDSQKQTLVARGKPRLLDRGDKVDGRMMTYDLGSRVGTIYEAKTAYERGIYRGERIRKVGQNELDVMNGSYSTCNLETPHYHFGAHWMKIYLKDKLVAKPVVFYLRNVPVLALPFYVFPIKPGRHSGFVFPQFEFGFNNRAGQFIRNAGYYWAPNDYMDLTLAGDYYQASPAYAIRADGNYKLLYHFDGTFSGRYEHNEATKHDDYVFDGSHTQDLSPRTRFIARGNFVSSRDYSASAYAGSTLEQRLNRFLTSSLSVSHAADWASIGVVADRRQDLDADQAIAYGFGTPKYGVAKGTFAPLPNLTINAPSLTMGFPSRTLGSWGLFKDTKAETLLASTYMSLNARYVSYSTRQAYISDWQYQRDELGIAIDSAAVLGQKSVTRRAFESGFGVSDSRRLWGWLNASPGIDGTVVVFDHDALGHSVVPAAVWSSHVGLSSTFYGTFKPRIPHVGGIRHVVFPSISYGYSPDFAGLQYRDSAGVVRSRFSNFGGIGISGTKSSYLSFGLDQRFQVKLVNGDKVTRLDNLIGWTTSGSYDFLWREHGAKHGLSTIPSQVTFTPPGFAQAQLAGTFDPYQGRPLRNLGFNMGASFSSAGLNKKKPASLAVEQTARPTEAAEAADHFRESWSASLAYSYSGGYGFANWQAQKTVNGSVAYQMTPNWHFDYSTAYDLTQRQMLTQRFSLTRVIHCWDATFTRSFTPGGSAEYYFRLGVRDQKEIYVERGTRVQSFGGIQ